MTHLYRIVHLSLRFCQIGDTGSERLANALGTMYIQNCKLLTLTLTGNQIGDHGAESFAKVTSIAVIILRLFPILRHCGTIEH